MLLALEAWGARRDWLGPDPYEGLNATRLVGPLRRTSFGRRALIQLVRRSPLDLRPLLGIAPRPSSAALALVASAYARGRSLPDADRKLRRCLERLSELRTRTTPEPAWGYHFDVETRFFFYPRTNPNVIATAFAGHAHLDAHAVTGDAELLRRAEGVGDFFLQHVPQTAGRAGAYFGYLVGDRTPIHNANLLVCSVLARLARRLPRPDFGRAAAAGVEHALAHQLPDGGWPYAEPASSSWIDGYHSGYVLEALLVCRECGLPVDDDALARGLEHYWSRLFRPDGTPRARTDAVHPIEGIAAAQGIQTFSRAAGFRPALLERAWSVFEYARTHLRRADGAFVFQRGRLVVNRIAHVRWVQAPMFLALTHLLGSADSR